MSKPINPPVVRGAGRRELPAYVANGLIGLRVRDNPLSAGQALLSGYVGEHPERQIEAAATAPYPLAADIAINGVWMSDTPHQIFDLEQAYDFSCGELRTTFCFNGAERRIRVEVLTFCSRAQPSLACQEIVLHADGPCQLALRAIVDASTIGGQAARQTRDTPGEAESLIDGSLLWSSAGELSTCGVALVTELVEAVEAARAAPKLANNRLVTEYQLKTDARRRIRLRQIASLVPEALHQAPDQQAARLGAKAAKDGFDKIRAENRTLWRDLWKGRIKLVGAGDRWQGLADAAFFYLNTSVHTASPASTSIFGLATWHDYHYYYGHVMWDIEAFALAPLSLLQPRAARALLDYRRLNLEGARRNARLRGREGLQFPWESAPRSGEEAAPLPGSASWHEDHVSLDVAHAFAAHAHVTGDLEFLRTKAWPVISGVARWIVSRVTLKGGAYVIEDSMGIAERQAPVDNPAFTTMAAVVVLREAIEIADRLGRAPDPAWARVADRISIPTRDGAIISHDHYRTTEEKGATPDPLMGIFPFGYPAGGAAEAATLKVYLEMAEAYIGSPMLSALYGAWAARTGDRDLALKLLDEGYGQFCVGRFWQTLEYRADRFPDQPQAGPFFANIGGFLISLLFGFPRLLPSADDPQTWGEADVVLPAGWSAIEIERLWIRGQPMSLSAVHGQRAKLTPAGD